MMTTILQEKVVEKTMKMKEDEEKVLLRKCTTEGFIEEEVEREGQTLKDLSLEQMEKTNMSMGMAKEGRLEDHEVLREEEDLQEIKDLEKKEDQQEVEIEVIEVLEEDLDMKKMLLKLLQEKPRTGKLSLVSSTRLPLHPLSSRSGDYQLRLPSLTPTTFLILTTSWARQLLPKTFQLQQLSILWIM